MTDMQETCFKLKQIKEAVSVQMQMDSFTFHINVQVKDSNPKTVYKCSPLSTYFLSSSKGSDISPSEICSPGVAGGTDSGISPSEVGINC